MEYSYLNYLDKNQTEIYILKRKYIINNVIYPYPYMYSKIEIFWSNTLFKKLIFFFLILVYNFYSFYATLKIDLFNFHCLNNVKSNKFFLSKYFKNLSKEEDIYFNITSINFSIELKKNIIKTEYLIGFYDINKTLILPSDLTLYNNFHVLCSINETSNNITIVSLANIFENKYYKCIEFFNKNDEIIFGIKIYITEKNIEFNTIYLYSYKKSKNLKYFYRKNDIFDCIFFNQEYDNFIKLNKNLQIKKSYLLRPICSSKNKINIQLNEWYFNNFFNYYFCFCKGQYCLFQNIPPKCKYYFYLSIIDNNKDIYNKTEYLFGDFIYNEYSSDDTFPVFEEMINKNFPVHYLTQNNNIYKKYCHSNKKCLSIIKVINNNDIINGDFLEKYLTLFLKLKVVASGAEFFFIDNLFYNIDYITYISVGHGISYFKSFLYANYSYYGNKIYNKILIPPSKKLISMVKEYGWENDDIIKINLPRWDKYNIYENNRNKSIFIMFTWRVIKENKTISDDYIKNISALINNDKLIEKLKEKNISFYFAFHHREFQYKSKIKLNKYINYIEEKDISDTLSKTNLLVTDFSSIIFDLIYRRKPFIIFIPDSKDSSIENKYDNNYFKLIKDMKSNKIEFENKCFSVQETVLKIIFYIDKDFRLEKRLKKFYDSFEFKKENNTLKFIEYIENLKI